MIFPPLFESCKRDTSMKTCAAFVIFCTLSVSAFAAPLSDSGNAFLAECSALDRPNDPRLTNIEMAKNMQCLSYMEGLMDGALYENMRIGAESRTNMRSLEFCRPEGVNNIQLVRVALKYVRDNPGRAHLPTVVLVFAAMKGAFPCSR